MLGARTSRPPERASARLITFLKSKPLFALRAQCGRDVRAPGDWGLLVVRLIYAF